jgi:probable HAF family extracellular repeat protein
MFSRHRKSAHLLGVSTILGFVLCLQIAGTAVAATTPSAEGHTLRHSSTYVRYQFQTINNNADPTFNQLLGINNHGEIAGYFGSGAVVHGILHPNKGYTVFQPYSQGNFRNENFPGSIQTQVTAINHYGDTAGFWVDGNGNSFDFVQWDGGFASYMDPHTRKSNGIETNQLLGLNDQGIAVGFYMDRDGNDHAYKLDQDKNTFSEIPTADIPGAISAMATGINDNGDVVGTYTDANGAMHGFLLKGGRLSVYDFPYANGVTNTTFLGVNIYDQIVGNYTVGTGDATQTHGFIMSSPLHHAQWQTIDDPQGSGTTTINGINDHADLVGFYVDWTGNTDGLLAYPG